MCTRKQRLIYEIIERTEYWKFFSFFEQKKIISVQQFCASIWLHNFEEEKKGENSFFSV